MLDKSQHPQSSPVSHDAETIADEKKAIHSNAQASPADASEMVPAPAAVRPVWPPVGQSYRRRETLSPAFRVLLVLLACLLVVGGLGLVVFSSARQYRTTLHTGATTVAQGTQESVNTAQAQSQGTAQAFSTAQANIEASATSQADAATNATATADDAAANTTATATSLDDVYTQATSGTPDFSNGLSDNTGDGKWDEGVAGVNTGCSFTDNEYHVSEAQQGFFQPCIAEDTNFSNFAYQVDLTINKGNGGQAGIVFRVSSDNKAYYLFRVGIDGSYAFDVYDENGKVNTLVQGFSSAITTSFSQSNTLSVIATDSQYMLYVNQQYVYSVTDKTLQGGKIGVVAINAGTPIDVTAGNVQVWKV